MEPDDEVQVLAFSSQVTPLGLLGPMREVGEELINKVNGLFAEGNTALYDSIATAMNEIEHARASAKQPRLYGVVVLSDGKDTSSRTKNFDLMARMPKGEDTESIKVFTIAFGKEADVDFLKDIAERSNAVSMKGDESNIEMIYNAIATYF